MLAIKLPEETEARLDIMAKACGLTAAAYAMEAVLTYLEDCEDAAMAEAAYSEFKASGERGIPLAEVERRLGLGD